MDAEKRTQTAQDGLLKSGEVFPGQPDESATCASGAGHSQSGELFSDQPKPKTCLFCGKKLTVAKKNKIYCDNLCRAHASKARKKNAKKERLCEYRNSALSFAEQNPDVVYKIAEWIREEKEAGYVPSFRYFWEKYRVFRNREGRPVQLNNNFEKTIKQLILNRFPELSAMVKIKEK